MMMLKEYELKDKDGKHVEFGSDKFGCKVIIKIYRPEMVLLVDEVGANLDMTGGGNIGGYNVICDKGCIEQRKSTKSKTFHSYWA